MNGRRMRELIHFLRPVSQGDDRDTGQDVIEYQRYHRKVPCNIEEVAGGKTRRGMQVEAHVDAVVVVRGEWRSSLDNTYRVEIAEEPNQGQVFEITKILDRVGKNEFLEVHCSKVA